MTSASIRISTFWRSPEIESSRWSRVLVSHVMRAGPSLWEARGADIASGKGMCTSSTLRKSRSTNTSRTNAGRRASNGPRSTDPVLGSAWRPQPGWSPRLEEGEPFDVTAKTVIDALYAADSAGRAFQGAPLALAPGPMATLRAATNPPERGFESVARTR